MPPFGSRFLPEQHFDVRIEGVPRSEQGTLRLLVDGKEVSLQPVLHGEHLDATVRALSFVRPGTHELVAVWGGGNRLARAVTVQALPTTRDLPVLPALPARASHGAKNVIFFLGDGMGLAHRTAARVLSRGYEEGHAKGRLAMDGMEATGLVMTSSLNALITDSAPGMSAYTTGSKANNNQMGVFPDDTSDDPWDNPSVEYLTSWLRHRRGAGFHAGIVTTADLTDATPAACAVHIASRKPADAIARALVDGREAHALSVLMGGGRRHFQTKKDGGDQAERDLLTETLQSGFAFADDAPSLAAAGRDPQVTKLLALFHPDSMNTAFDKLGFQAGYSDELRPAAKEGLRRQPALAAMTSAALAILSRTSPAGFFLVVEGASIDKKSHDQDAERAIWDVIEMDNAVGEALAFAKQSNDNANPDDDTLVIVTADHETGGLSLAAVGNERYQPALLGKAVRDYAANLRFDAHQTLPLFPNYEQGPDGFPRDPDPSRKLILGFGAGSDRFENFTSNRLARPGTKVDESKKAVANPERDGPHAEDQSAGRGGTGLRDQAVGATTDNRNVGGRAIPGFLVSGLIENGADQDPRAPGDTSSVAAYSAGHTASDVPLSASGPGAAWFVGTFDNTDAFFKLAAALGAWKGPLRSTGRPTVTPGK